MRKLCEKTQVAYIRAVRKLAAYLKRSPDTANAEELRRFQLRLVDHGTSPATLNATIMGLKFFFGVTLNRGELMPRCNRCGCRAPNLKSQTALSIAYGTGLRASEVIALKVGDIDSERMMLRVEQGKGQKDRYASSRPYCWSGCGAGGDWATPRERSCPAAGCSLA